MKKFAVLFIILAFSALCLNVFGQKKYAFDVAIKGSGKQAIVFIPGFTCSGDVYDETVANFEKNYTCYVLTMAGFAGVPAQVDASFANWENSIADYIKTNNLNKPIIVGHSMGGGLAMAVAADYPTLVSKLVIIDALPCLAAMMDPNFKAKPNNDCSASVAQFTGMPDSQFYQMQKLTIPRLLADTTRTEEVVSWSVKSDRKTFASMYCDFVNTDLRDKISAVSCPTLVLLESYFTNFKPTIEAQYKNLKTAQLAYATKGLHFIMYDDKEWYNMQLNNFINNK